MTLLLQGDARRLPLAGESVDVIVASPPFYRDGQEEPAVAYFLLAKDGEVLNLKRMQSEPMLNPAGRLFEHLPSNHDRVRMLAAEVLRRHDPKAYGRTA